MAMSIIAAKITSHFKTDVILYAFIATSAVTFLCVVLAYSNVSWFLRNYSMALGKDFLSSIHRNHFADVGQRAASLKWNWAGQVETTQRQQTS